MSRSSTAKDVPVAPVEKGDSTEQNNNTITTKARYWVGIGYLENMREDWQDEISEILQLPYAYCIHDKDIEKNGDPRKAHVHIMIAWPNTTTYKAALTTFRLLNAPGRQAFNTCEKVQSVRHKYNYLIHDTEDCRKKHKHLYEVTERITGNNFDIGSYEQITTADKQRMRVELGQLVSDKQITDYLELYLYVAKNLGMEYEEVLVTYSSHFSRLVRAMFLKVGR